MNTFAKIEAEKQKTALKYLKTKFSDVDEKVFRTDYMGYLHDEIINWPTILKAEAIEKFCEACNGSCNLPENVRAKNSRPFVTISESPKGFKFLDVRWACDLHCKFNPLSSYSEKFVRTFKKSGLSISQLNMTFKAYKCSNNNPELITAKYEAMNAAEEQSWLILAGKQGTGKTHLAVAIALKNLEQGRPVIFRLVSRMLDEIQNAIKEDKDYDGLMKNFKKVPCLILDDLGHENMTAARASYLHQIIDYRHSENLQTIITTNAKNFEELSRLCGADFVMPIVSRFAEHGVWVKIENAKDFRPTKFECEVKNND